MRVKTSAVSAAIGLTLFGCVGDIDPYGSDLDDPTFEEFESETYREPWEGGVYIVNGDTPVENAKKLREYYTLQFASDGALIVHQNGGADARWSNARKRNLTYCVSSSFGNRYAAAVAAMEQAAGQWEAAADVDFIHVSSQDSSCRASNQNVLFDVRPVSGQQYLARAFFPDQGRSSRNVLIDSSAFSSSWAIDDILAHELGHALGFRHEHTRPEAGTCFEDNNWRPLTPYDSASIMHYPQCNGSSNALSMTNTDRAGAASLYGAPGGGGGEPPGGGGGGDSLDEANLAGGAGAELYFQMVVPDGATDVSFTMSGGSGDADLYVRKNRQVSSSSYDCRPYKSGNNESCGGSGAGTYYVMVRGYSSFSGVSLRGRYTAGGGGGGTTTVQLLDERDLSASRGRELRFDVTVPRGGRNLSFVMSGGSGDADLYVKKGGQATTTSFDCRPYATGNNETCEGDGDGTYSVMVRAYTAFSGVRLQASYDQP